MGGIGSLESKRRQLFNNLRHNNDVVFLTETKFKKQHVDTYRHKVIMGAHKKSNLVKDLPDGDDSIMDSAIDVDFLERPIDDPSQVVLHKEMLLSSNDQAREI